jgi:hypothetical protein
VRVAGRRVEGVGALLDFVAGVRDLVRGELVLSDEAAEGRVRLRVAVALVLDLEDEVTESGFYVFVKFILLRVARRGRAVATA